MQLSVSFPDLEGFPPVLVTVTAETTVQEAIHEASTEWGVEEQMLEFYLEGEHLSNTSRLVSSGVSEGSELTASVVALFSRKWLEKDDMRKKASKICRQCHKNVLRLDTPTFAVSGSISVPIDWVPKGVDKVVFCNPSDSVTSISDSFLQSSNQSSNLHPWEVNTSPSHRPLDLLGLSTVTSVGNFFLCGVTSLTTLDLSCFSNITSIGDNFLDDCMFITSINLSGMCNVRTIGNSFMSGCVAIKSIDTSMFQSLTSVGKSFLRLCGSITALDLSGLRNVTALSDEFMPSLSLASVHLDGLNNVTAIGHFFMHWCSLSEIDLSALSNVSSIGDGFLSDTHKLTSIDMSGLSNVTSIGDQFLFRCFQLTVLDISALSSVTSIGDSFLGGCEFASPPDLAHLSSVKSVGRFFYESCSRLEREKFLSTRTVNE